LACRRRHEQAFPALDAAHGDFSRQSGMRHGYWPATHALFAKLPFAANRMPSDYPFTS
jgi:hypothetical protein